MRNYLFTYVENMDQRGSVRISICFTAPHRTAPQVFLKCVFVTLGHVHIKLPRELFISRSAELTSRELLVDIVTPTLHNILIALLASLRFLSQMSLGVRSVPPLEMVYDCTELNKMTCKRFSIIQLCMLLKQFAVKEYFLQFPLSISINIFPSCPDLVYSLKAL